MNTRTLAIRVFSGNGESDTAMRCRLLHESAGQVDHVQIFDRSVNLDASMQNLDSGLIILDDLPELAEEILEHIHKYEVPIVVVLLLADPADHGQAFINRLLDAGLLSVEPADMLDNRVDVTQIMSAAAGRLRQLMQFAGFRTLIEHTQDVITVMDSGGIIRYESPSLHTVLGYSPDELIGQTPFPLIHPDDREGVVSLFNEERTAVGQARSASYRFRHADGTRVHLESRAKVFQFSDGKSGIIISSRDVGERMSAMDLLRAREQQLEESERLTHIGSWRWNPRTDTLEWSSEMYRIYGFDPGSPLGMDRFRDAIHPDDRNVVDDAVQECLDTRKPFKMTHRIIRPDGDVRTLEGRGEFRPSLDDDDDILFGTGRDITEQVTSREAVEKSERRFRSLFESSPDGILVLDDDGRVQDANGSALEILGKAKEELIEQKLSVVWTGSDPFTPELMREVLSNQASRMTKQIDLGVSVRHIDITIGSLIESSGRRSTLFLRDVSDRVHSEEMLRRLGRHRQDLLERERKRISREVHDIIGQALTSLKMDTEWAASHLDDGKTQERLQNMADKITDTINTARRIAHELRPGILDDFGLGAAVEWYAKTVSERSGLAIKIGTMEHDALPDELQLTLFRICQELLTNVVRHAKATQVLISIGSVGRNLTVSVTDNGQGLQKRNEHETTSLGMMGIRERLSPWKGRLEVESNKGGGTRAEIIILLLAIESRTES